MNKIMRLSNEKRSLDTRIVLALGKLFNSFRNLLWEVGKKENLSPIQIQLLLFLKDNPRDRCTIGNLAKEFDMTPATISDAITTLQNKGVVLKRFSKKDARVTFVSLTSKAYNLIKKLSTWSQAIGTATKNYSQGKKEVFFILLLKLIESLHEGGAINVARTCMSCRNFIKNKFKRSYKPHFCKMINKPIGSAEIQIDCASYITNQ